MAYDAESDVRRYRRSQVDDRGIPLNVGGPMPTYGWEAFFGALQRQKEEAAANGGSFRADLSGIGGDGSLGNPGGGRLTPQDREGIAGNVFLGQLTDQNRARLLQDQMIANQMRDDAVGGMQKSYDQQVLASTVPQAKPPVTTAGKDAAGNLSVTMRPNPTETPLERMASVVPGTMQPALTAQIAAQDLKERAQKVEEGKLAETVRKDQATEAGGDEDVKAAVEGMKNGTLPPQLPGRASKEYTKTLAEAKRQGYDLAGAATDWTATQKHIATMNGAQQLRLNQSVNALPDMLDSVETLSSQWKGGGFPILNKANLSLAKNGAFGKDAASIATRLDAQIADVTADLGNVYMGGNSPTDHALDLAGKSLNANWDEKVLKDAIDMARKNVQIRQNSIRNTGVAGASPNNPYAAPPAATAAAAPNGGGTVKMRAPNGAMRDVPADQVNHYLQLGAVKVGG